MVNTHHFDSTSVHAGAILLSKRGRLNYHKNKKCAVKISNVFNAKKTILKLTALHSDSTSIQALLPTHIS
ncbi:hypothetical protein CF65_01770 [Aggregatibacter actinomycetemcomitans HK1651]|nr:hypothetical protein CF65_01770 [Aggregatibacter actinomycetemcomitans HK1651]